MQFNSSEYLLFFLIVFFVFWFLLRNRITMQNIFLLIANYVFYAWWDWRFLFLLVFISLTNFYSGIQIGIRDPDTQNNARKKFLILAIAVNLTVLAVFKYFNFFAGSLTDLFNLFGIRADMPTLNLILPIGISFYTFQTMSYAIDVYRLKIEPTRNIVAFFAYVSFFPLILAGPIERAGNLLIQFFKKREFHYGEGADAMRQILWGFFKKVVIADNCAVLADQIFIKYKTEPASVLVLGVIYFAFQIYGDFSGYSDIAIGSAKLLGFKLTTNFRTPYFSRDIAEFWRRWHISLSNWLRDYIFIPLNIQLRYLEKWGGAAAILITFLICGLWHGANWTFIAWGGLNGLYLIPLLLKSRSGQNQNTVALGRYFPNLKETFQIISTFMLTCIGWIFFKSESLHHAFFYMKNLFSASIFSVPDLENKSVLVFIFLLILMEWINREEEHPLRFNKFRIPKLARTCIYLLFIYIIFTYGVFEKTVFIYFAF